MVMVLTIKTTQRKRNIWWEMCFIKKNFYHFLLSVLCFVLSAKELCQGLNIDCKTSGLEFGFIGEHRQLRCTCRSSYGKHIVWKQFLIQDCCRWNIWGRVFQWNIQCSAFLPCAVIFWKDHYRNMRSLDRGYFIHTIEYDHRKSLL